MHSTYVFKNSLWVLGGRTHPGYHEGLIFKSLPPNSSEETQVYRDIWRSSGDIEWEQITPHKPYWSSRAMIGDNVVFRNRLWVIGGAVYETHDYSTHRFMRDVWSSEDGIHWTLETAETPWIGKAYKSVVVFDDKLWVIAGKSVLGNTNEVWYSDDGRVWTELPDAPFEPRHAASVVVHDDRIWVGFGTLMKPDTWKLAPSL